MSSSRGILAILAALASAAAVRADLGPPGAAGAGPSRTGLSAAPAQTALPDTLLFGEWPAGPAAADLAASAGRELQLRRLPPVPDSAALFSLALGTLGAWQLGRCSRKLHLHAWPDWYHAGGPAQVGRARPLELGATLADWPVCPFAARPPAAPVVRLIRFDYRPRARESGHLLLRAPRAPPSI